LHKKGDSASVYFPYSYGLKRNPFTNDEIEKSLKI